MILLARTWNGNDSGLLWEKLWGRDEKGLCAKLICSGVFTDPVRYESNAEFWAAYGHESLKFAGRVMA